MKIIEIAPSRRLIAPLLLMAFSSFAFTATASPYVFTKITDAPFRAASMNNLGEVAYLTNSEIVLTDGASSLSMIAHAAQVLEHPVLAPLAPPDGQGIGLNDLGTVVYHCVSDQSCLVRRDGSVAGGIPAQLASPSINNLDEVAFGASIASPTAGIRVVYGSLDASQHGDMTPSGNPDAPAINDSGEVLFSAAHGSTSAYFVGNGANLRQIGPAIIDGSSFEAYGLNDPGTVIGRQSIAGVDSLSLFYKDGSSDLIVDTTQLASFFPFGINDLDEIAFYGRENGPNGDSGIFIGSRSGFQRIFGEGDSLLGFSIISLNLIARDALNNQGQIVFAATTAEGTALYRASPVPIPSSFLLMSVGLIFLVGSATQHNWLNGRRSAFNR